VNESVFAKTVMDQKYAHDTEEGKETWEQISHRVPTAVLKAVGAPKSQVKETEAFIAAKKFIPGGRYLAASGRPFHQTQNCLLMSAEDSREGWSNIMHQATMGLMSGAGIGVWYGDLRGEGRPIRKTGGFSSGPLALMQMVNEAGRWIRQGGDRRSAIWAGLPWDHPDIMKFITMKNWSDVVREMKAKDYNFPAPMDGTNISVGLDDKFFKAYSDDKHEHHALAQGVYWSVVRQMLKTAEPGFSVNTGANRGENLRNACVPGEVELLTRDGYQRIDALVGTSVEVWNGFEWSTVEPRVTGTDRQMVTVRFNSGQSLTCTDTHEFWVATDYQGGREKVRAQDLQEGMKLIKHDYPVLPEGKRVNYAYTQGFLSGDGMDDYRFFSVYGNKDVCMKRMSGTVGAFSKKHDKTLFKISFDQHPKDFVPFGWNLQSRLDWFAGLLDADGTELREGGSQVGSVDRNFLLQTQKMLTTLGIGSKVTGPRKGGIKSMPDGNGGHKDYFCQDLYRLLVGAVQMQAMKRLGLKCERLSFEKFPQRDASQFVTVTEVEDAGVAETVYCFNEPKRHLGCFDGIVTGQCTEITSRDDSDICNLGSINMANIESLEEMQKCVELGTAFLLAGTVYSDVPYGKVDGIRTKNRRLGLGLMGIHEWLLKHGKPYGPDEELAKYLEIYAKSTEIAAKYAKEWDLTPPVKTRAIAPTGTIGIIAETTTGMEPIFCVAYKRRYLKGNVINYQYVIDPAAQRLIEGGIAPEAIEDAYVLAENVERRVAFQAWLQQYVDHSISSTINLPAWGSELNNESRVREFGDMLMKYLPQLRGITCYPDGARGGQPLTPVAYKTAVKHTGEVFSEVVLEQADVCDITKGGSCGA
jgi:ribonucleotide reductase alpha subunit